MPNIDFFNIFILLVFSELFGYYLVSVINLENPQLFSLFGIIALGMKAGMVSFLFTANAVISQVPSKVYDRHPINIH